MGSVARDLVLHSAPQVLASRAQQLLEAQASLGCTPDMAPNPVALEPTFRDLAAFAGLPPQGKKVATPLPWRPYRAASPPRRFRAWIPPRDTLDWLRAEHFLKMLCPATGRLGFELTGNREGLSLELLADERQERSHRRHGTPGVCARAQTGGGGRRFGTRGGGVFRRYIQRPPDRQVARDVQGPAQRPLRFSPVPGPGLCGSLYGGKSASLQRLELGELVCAGPGGARIGPESRRDDGGAPVQPANPGLDVVVCTEAELSAVPRCRPDHDVGGGERPDFPVRRGGLYSR